MAVRKTRNFLPTVFQTDTNEKFLSATMDQLISEPTLTNVYGYVGRKFAPTFKSSDSYVTETTADRQNYQLEASTVVRDESNDITFFSNYIDYLNKLKYYGAFVDNQSRLFNAEYYTFDPRVSFDKFVNFSQYYWLPDGPDIVEVNTTGLELEVTYNVTRDLATGKYVYTSNGIVDNSVTLPRGGVYKFVIDQPGFPFWIQTELGTDGLLSATPTLSSRDILGVENNGTDNGTITFTIPQKTAQDRFISMPVAASVDYATPARFSDWENQTVSQFQSVFPQWNGITGQLDGKQLIFVEQDQFNNEGEAIWTVPNVINPTTGNVIPGYDAGTIIADDQRFGVWQVNLLDIGIDDPLIRLIHIRDISIDQKVYIRYGVMNANKEYYKDYDGFFHQTPLMSSLANILFAQDEVNSAINTLFKVVDYNAWTIDVETDIIGQQTYTSPNGVEFTSGLKIQFGDDVTPAYYQNRQFYVEQVGDVGGGIQLVPIDELVTPELYNDENKLNYPDEVFPEYITINRSSIDRNPWSRNNRWFHREVISKTAEYRNEIVTFDQKQRAQRPIIQFESNLLLFNNGRIGKYPVDILDTTTLDAFTELEGQVLTTAFGITLTDGLRVIFSADQDPLVRDKIYTVNLVQYVIDPVTGLPTGPEHIKLVMADDGNAEPNDTVVITQGQYKGSQWWYNGTQWLESQQKTEVQQDPLFDVFYSSLDTTTLAVDPGRSISQFARSTFAGTKLFSYMRSQTGTNDPVLGFPLSYRNFATQGDIEFQNYFTTDTFSYADDLGNILTENISVGFLQKIVDRYILKPKNTWETAIEFTKQYQSIGYVYDGTSNIFPIDVTPNTADSVPYIKVFKNFRYLSSDQWVLISNQVRLTTAQKFIGDGVTTAFSLTNATSTTNGVLVLINGIPRKASGYYNVSDLIVTFTSAPKQGDIVDIRVIDTPNIGDKIDILVYSNDISKLGFYQVPLNLDLNAQNVDINVLTLGQVRNHLVALGQNSTTIVGDVLGVSNLRDVDIKQQGGTILQHSAPVPYGELFLLDDQANFIDSLRYAQREYTKFKNKFLELSGSLSGIQPTDPVASVDLIITEINKIKNPTFPWVYSDMIPYGTLKNTITYTVFDPLKIDYEITNVFNDQQLSNQATLIYLNGRQLIKGLDYEFLYDRPAVRFITELSVDDSISVIEYSNTDGCYVPETPTKLGLWPKFVPELFNDDTYRTPIDVIRGHDGSITPTFGDYRDDILLELELRIFNNIKLPDTGTYGDIFATIPGKFRDSEYTLTEITQLVSKNFQSWVGNNKLDFSINNTFKSNDLFTWNYGPFNDRIDGEQLPGSWRACYQYFYDTVYPHKFPWEMLGFSVKPNWWETYYGPGPYTSGNQLLWQDLEAGRIRYGVRAGIDSNYVRPGLTTIIPVDENGNLLPPASLLTASYAANRAASSWAVGQYGPVEYAWRTSSDFPFAVQQGIALAKPGRYFGLNLDTYRYSQLNALIDVLDNGDFVSQFLTAGNNQHLKQTDIYYNGQDIGGTVYRGAGYLNWIADYLTSQGINPYNKILPLVKNYQVNLAYKVAGFTSQNYLNVLAEQISPGSTNDTIVIPNENYKVYLNKSTPTQKLTYSGVIVEKTSNGYSVRGYDLNNPFFTIIPSIVNSNATKITVLNKSATIFKDYQNLKLTVPYGYEFTSPQQIVDFLISYERYLLAQGFTFTALDSSLGELRNWKLSAKEFLYWIQQGWQTGSILVLSPVANVLNAISLGAITDGISDSQYSSRVIDQNFKLIKNVNYEVLRSPTNFKLTLTDPASVIGYVEIDLVQFEHVLVFDNVTVFNDIIYKPELGNRQFRLKLIGQKTANWDGSLYAPGFIYNSGTVDLWEPGVDYLQGDLVEYKNQYYTALQNIIASTDFQFVYWKQIPSSQIQEGLLPNFSTLASESKAYYNSYPSVDDKKHIEYSHGLIGFRPRQYLSDLGLTTTTQIEFYKGFIKQKGSMNAVNQLVNSKFNNLTGNINLYEEWAIRLGTYGALDVNPYVEIALDEKSFGVNPGLAQFVPPADNNIADGITVFNKSQLYKSTDQFTGNIALNRTASSDYSDDILTAGYVNIDDVDAIIFDLADYVDLDSLVGEIGSGYTIWCAKDFSQQWNVYRITETNNFITTVTNSLDGYITFTSNLPHKLSEKEIFLVRNFDVNFDGFYQVYKVVDLNNVIVKYNGNTQELTTLTGNGMFFILNTLRFQYMEDCRIYGQPPNQWKVGEKIWIDDDAATSAVQGQPYGTQPSGTWKVYEKQHPWSLKQTLPKNTFEYASGDGYGTSVKMSADGLIVVTGSPFSGNGVVNTFLKDYRGDFLEGFSISSVAADTKTFGFALDLASDKNNASILAVGAPNSYGNVGYVLTYFKSSTNNSYNPTQILVGEAGDKFGSSIAYNQDGNWLYIGAPGNNKVYIYGLDHFIPTKQEIVSVNNENIITLGNATSLVSITANVGDIITEPITGATAIVQTTTYPSGSSNVMVNSLTNINPIPGATNTLANILLSDPISASVGEYITQSTSSANIFVYRGVAGSNRVYGLYQNSNRFDTIGNIAIGGNVNIVVAGNLTTIHPTYVGSGNLFLNGVDTGLYANVTYSRAIKANISFNELGFTPAVNDVNSLLISSGTKTYIPGVDYSLDYVGGNIAFSSNIAQSDITITQQPYYVLLANVTGNANSNFGYALSSSFDGAQLAVGAPLDSVAGADGNLLIGAGTVWVYDRVIEAFSSTGNSDYTTKNVIGQVYRVTIDNIEVYDYLVNPSGAPTNTIRFITPPPVGKVIYIETNQFVLLEKLIGVDSLEGGLTAIQANTYFGTSLTICSNNCAIYVGAPNYDNGIDFNTGAVWKFHNRGRLYGTNNGYVQNPVFTPGDSIRLDNYEVIVSSRMMPNTTTGVGNILTLSSNVVAVAGQTISQYHGSGQYANVTVLANTGVLGSQFISVTDYTTAYTFNYGQSSIGANVVSVNGTVTSAYPMASLDSLIKDINDANLLGISAVNENGYLRLKSDSTVAKNLLRILAGTTQPGSQGVYLDAGMIIFAFMQIIINPFQAAGEYFGSKVKLAANAYMLVIGSGRGTTRGFTTFDDNATILDNTATRMFDSIQSSGSVYIYELYDDPRNEVEHPGRYAYAQQLNPGNLNSGDQFGYALDIEGTYITISAPNDDGEVENGGSVYIFENPTMIRGWKLIRYQEPKVDIDSVTRTYLYSSITNTILDNLQFIDPAKGRILGQAEQEITFKTEYDPAIYNRGSNPAADINTSVYWGDSQIGKVWWNLSMVRFIDYEQDTLTYRSRHWGELFPGSIIEVLEWVESTVLPSQYVASGGDGVPKYADNSAYVEIIHVDPTTNIIGSLYYFWVKDKKTVDPNDPTRNIPISSVADIITNPKNQGISYAAVIRDDAVILYNIGQYLSAQNTILHLDYQLINNTNIIHSEYELVQKGNPTNNVPTKIVDKLVDSLAGIDQIGAVVPDPALSVADSYGIEVRPRQSMFIDRLSAVNELVDYVNSVLINKPVARQYNLTQLNSSEAEPNFKNGEYDLRIETEVELEYIDVVSLPIGYKVLVAADTTQDNLWVLYELSADKTWNITRVQSYKTNLYWDFVDWFDFKPDGVTRYSLADKLDYVVDTLVDAKKLTPVAGTEILVRVNNGSSGGWNLLVTNEQGELIVVGIQNGTLQLKTSLGNFADNALGFGNQGYSTNRYDQNPNIEIRNIIYALKNDIFINELQGEFNNLFFVMVNYLFSEQKYVDWIFKTSFISATHDLRTLSQFPSYIVDNQTYYQDYIDEVKPYRTKIREYLINYTGNDEYPSTVTDFDLPPYYDTTSKIFRSPSGEMIDTDEAIWQTYPYNQWYTNRKLQVGSIIVDNAGLGYSTPPTVTIISGSGGGSGATATAYIDGNTGSITHITVDNSGSGYITTPSVLINGSCTVPAIGYAVLRNNQVRTFDTTLKFDRISYTSQVEEWTSNKTYLKTVFDANGYVISGNLVSYAQQDGNTYIRSLYIVANTFTTGNTFVSDNFTIYPAANIKTANDRIMGLYQPSSNQPARDLNQLVYGVEYPGVQVQGSIFTDSPLYGGTFDLGAFDNVTYDSDGNPLLSEDVIDTIIQSNYTDAALGTRAEDINVDGGAYVDRYSSHAPEEMIPGIVFDTLDMRVYTQANAHIYGYRIFNNMLRNTSYLRIADNYTTELTNALSISDTIITVANSSTLFSPDPTYSSHPGVVFIGAERITYWKNYANAMTAWTPNVSYAFGDGIYYGNVITFSGAVTANAGDILIQSTTGNAAVITMDVDNQTSVPLFYTNGTGFDLGSNIVVRVDQTNIINANVVGMLDTSNIMLSNAANIKVGDQIIFDATLPITSGNIYSGKYYYITSVVANTAAATANIKITNTLNGATFSNLIPALYPTVTVTIANVANTHAYPISSTTAYYITTTDTTATVFDYANVRQIASPNVLGQIRRGTQGTAVANTYPIGTLVTDASIQQIIPATVSGNVTLATNTAYTVTDTVSYSLTLSSNITANVGDTITQATSGTSATLLGFENEFGNSLVVSYNNTNRFNLFTGNLVLAGNIAINGIYTGNTYPTGSNIAGYNIDSTGNVTITANTVLQTANIWLNHGAGNLIATDGTGLEGATTVPALFIKAELAILNATNIKQDILVTEDAINTLTTENGIELTEE